MRTKHTLAQARPSHTWKIRTRLWIKQKMPARKLSTFTERRTALFGGVILSSTTVKSQDISRNVLMASRATASLQQWYRFYMMPGVGHCNAPSSSAG
jgi:hypothetical protein